jgi:hypothetical protein
VSAQWWWSLKKNTHRKQYQRLLLAGELTDNSEEPVYAHHVRAVNRALAKMNTWEAARRKFVLTTMWRCAGVFRVGVD